MSAPQIDERMALALYLEVLDHCNRAHGKERVRLRALLNLPAEPCTLWEHDGSAFCSTHGEIWHLHLPRPSIVCFAERAA